MTIRVKEARIEVGGEKEKQNGLEDHWGGEDSGIIIVIKPEANNFGLRVAKMDGGINPMSFAQKGN